MRSGKEVKTLMITAGSKAKVNSNSNPAHTLATVPEGAKFRKWDGKVYTVVEKGISQVRIRRTGYKVVAVSSGTEVLEILPANYVEEEPMKSEETTEPDTGSTTEKETTVKTATKAKTAKAKASPKTAKREGNVAKKKEKLDQPDRKVIKGVTGFKTERAEIPVKSGHFVYDAGKGYGVWDPAKQRRIKWIPKKRVVELLK